EQIDVGGDEQALRERAPVGGDLLRGEGQRDGLHGDEVDDDGGGLGDEEAEAELPEAAGDVGEQVEAAAGAGGVAPHGGDPVEDGEDEGEETEQVEAVVAAGDERLVVEADGGVGGEEG